MPFYTLFLFSFLSVLLLWFFPILFSSFLMLAHVVLWWWWCYDSLLMVAIVPVLILCTVRAFYILPTVTDFTILVFNHFCLVQGVPPDHPLVCQLSNHHHLLVLAVPLPITRQRSLFCLFAHCGILSYYPLWHAPSGSNSSFLLLGDMSS